ncbi:hypothetical protein [Holdemanella porci]|uniref:hypothetical protein n=1 Tax=Holdemanella porci TaxID=2652276 RepID=UPI003F8E6B38
MLLLNTKSCLDCDDLNTHNQEITDIIESISQIEDYDCALLCKYQDSAHKHLPQKIESCKISELLDFLGTRDIKNGIDLFFDGNYLIFILYGQNYEYKNQKTIYHTIEAIKVLPYNEKKDFINLNISNNIKMEEN